MRVVALVACLGALALIALLPRIFFRRGRLNARWWLTATPFAVSGATLLAGLAGRARPLLDAGAASALAVALALGGIALIRWTLATHARPVSLWHQDDDRPDELVTRGAYARVRHPFYASFLLVLLACACALPHALTFLAFGAGVVLLNRTAAREERRLTRAFGARYTAYRARTNRFLPRLAARSLVVGALLAAAPAQTAAQLGVPSATDGKLAAPPPPEQSLGNDVLVGTSMGLMAGLAVGGTMCLWEEFSTVGLTWGDEEEEDYECESDAPLLAIGTGAAAGALVGLIVGLFDGDMPRGDFFEWSTRDPQEMPDEPKQSKIDDAALEGARY